MSPMRLADNCGECMTEDHAVTVQPHQVWPAGDDGVRAYYRCPRCGHEWWTSWSTAGETADVTERAS